MLVVLAIDGSPCSSRALDLVAGLEWPPDTTIRLVAALETGPALFGVPWLAVMPLDSADLESQMATELRRVLDDGVARLTGPERSIQQSLLRGRPATAIVEDARAVHADLIVVGSRGHGVIESMLLGSTSSEIVDHAPCPVLVARTDTVHSLVFAEDGSEGALAALVFLETWPIFAGHPARIVSVADVPAPIDPGIAPGVYGAMLDTYASARDETSQLHWRLARESADRLTEAGLAAEPEERDGDPATQLVRAAEEHRADLIIVGSKGRTGLARLVLGSVARNVLLHAHCSVLVVREPHHVKAGREAAKDEPVAVG